MPSRRVVSAFNPGDSTTSPLHPNHSPPRPCMAAVRPTASPPGDAPRLGTKTRLETATRRAMNSSRSAPALLRRETLQPEAHGGRILESPARGHEFTHRDIHSPVASYRTEAVEI